MVDDRQIIDLYKSRQIDTIDILVERYKDSLYKFCCHLTSNRQDADDLFQDTWVKAVQNIQSFDTSRKFSTWLFSIALNGYRDKYRKAKRWLNRVKDFFSADEKEDELSKVASSSPLPDEQAVDNEARTALMSCMNSLDDTFRIPLMLFYFKDMKYEDISEILNIPVGTVKSRINSGKAKLKKLLEVKGFE